MLRDTSRGEQAGQGENKEELELETMVVTEELAAVASLSLSMAGAEPARVCEITGGVGRDKAVAAAAPAAVKTKWKWAKVVMTKEEVDELLSAPLSNRPFPTLTEKMLAGVGDMEFRERLRQDMIRAADLFHSLRQSTLRGREDMRRQVEDKGYAEGYMMVVDAAADDDDDVAPVGGAAAGDDDVAPVGGAATNDDITRHRAKL